jgi:hypothetical protein
MSRFRGGIGHYGARLKRRVYGKHRAPNVSNRALHEREIASVRDGVLGVTQAGEAPRKRVWIIRNFLSAGELHHVESQSVCRT